jgi:hypothetical protein
LFWLRSRKIIFTFIPFFASFSAAVETFFDFWIFLAVSLTATTSNYTQLRPIKALVWRNMKNLISHSMLRDVVSDCCVTTRSHPRPAKKKSVHCKSLTELKIKSPLKYSILIHSEPIKRTRRYQHAGDVCYSVGIQSRSE